MVAWITVDGRKHKLGAYGRNVLRRTGRWQRIGGLRSARTYGLAARLGVMKKLGRVKVVFSRRRGERKILALVTDELRASMKQGGIVKCCG